MKKIAYLLLVFAGFTACSTGEKRSDETTPARTAASVVDGESADTLLFNAIFDAEIKANANRNIVISPTSIKLALGMLAAGAANSDRAQTRDMLGKVLKGNQDELDAAVTELASLGKALKANKNGEILIANGAFSTGGKISDEYAAKLKQDFDALVAPANLEVINAFVSKNTKGLIPKILDQLDANSIAVLVNAIYFKGDWQTIFYKDKAREFTAANGKKKVDYAFFVAGAKPVVDGKGYATRDQKGELILEAADAGLREAYTEVDVGGKYVQVLRKPYGKKGGESNLAMYFILPPEGTSANSLAKTTLGSVNFWKSVNQKMRLTGPDGKQILRKTKLSEVRFPIVKIGTKINLKAGFEGTKRAGASLGEMFNEANFDPVNPAITHISQAVHVTYMAIDEKGTEAAAATAVEMATRSAVMPTDFIVNRPYLVTVMEEEKNEPLFMAVINDPTAVPEK